MSYLSKLSLFLILFSQLSVLSVVTYAGGGVGNSTADFNVTIYVNNDRPASVHTEPQHQGNPHRRQRQNHREQCDACDFEPKDVWRQEFARAQRLEFRSLPKGQTYWVSSPGTFSFEGAPNADNYFYIEATSEGARARFAVWDRSKASQDVFILKDIMQEKAAPMGYLNGDVVMVQNSGVDLKSCFTFRSLSTETLIVREQLVSRSTGQVYFDQYYRLSADWSPRGRRW